jgi:hypothetical protein
MKTQANESFHSPGFSANRLIASTNIEKESARRKTPFTSAARISARCQP